MDAKEFFASKNGGKTADEMNKSDLYCSNTFVVKTMEEYAKQKCIEQKEICIKNFPVENVKNIGIRVKIWESKLATDK